MMLGQVFTELAIRDPGFDDGIGKLLVDLQDPIEALKVQDDRTVHGRSRGAIAPVSTSTARPKGHTEASGRPYDFRDLIRSARIYYAANAFGIGRRSSGEDIVPTSHMLGPHDPGEFVESAPDGFSIGYHTFVVHVDLRLGKREAFTRISNDEDATGRIGRTTASFARFLTGQAATEAQALFSVAATGYVPPGMKTR
jgi:hypothetical protein